MKRILASLLALLVLCSCSPAPAGQAEQLNIVTTTYPAYLLALTVTQGVEGVSVSRLDTGSVSCLHDYTLSVNDMKKIARADVLVLSGAGLEDFMSDALASSDALVIHCSDAIELLPAAGHEGHDHSHDHDHGHFDPHHWMDPRNMAGAALGLVHKLRPLLDSQSGERMDQNAQAAVQLLLRCRQEGVDTLARTAPDAALVTFHDGFAYFAAAFELPLLASIEEEAGSEASAKEINHITRLVREHGLAAIFTEVNGSDATARAISRETGCGVYTLSMVMDGREPYPDDPSPITPYIEAMNINIAAVAGAFGEAG